MEYLQINNSLLQGKNQCKPDDEQNWKPALGYATQGELNDGDLGALDNLGLF